MEGRYVEAADRIENVDNEKIDVFESDFWEKNGKLLDYLNALIAENIEIGKDPEQYIRKAFAIRPLNTDTIKTVLFSDVRLGNVERVRDICEMIENIYSERADMLYMAALGFEALDMKDRAVICMKNATLYATSDEEKEEYEAELQSMKV